MASLNKVFLLGNLTRDPEVRHTPKGVAVGDLGMAINMSYRTADGQEKEEVCYVDVVVWGRQAETCKDYLSKGSPIFVEGRLQLDQWETPEGGKKSKLRVRAERVQFLGGRGGSGGGGGRQGGERSHAPRPSQDEYSGGSSRGSSSHSDDMPPADDDIPF
jgi:single-strand DNA-binding protein